MDKLEATQPIKVFIDKKFYGQMIEHTQIHKIPFERRVNSSWKGCYYIIAIGEIFYFDRCNNWDLSYFKLENGAEFVIDCGNPQSFIQDNKTIEHKTK